MLLLVNLLLNLVICYCVNMAILGSTSWAFWPDFVSLVTMLYFFSWFYGPLMTAVASVLKEAFWTHPRTLQSPPLCIRNIYTLVFQMETYLELLCDVSCGVEIIPNVGILPSFPCMFSSSVSSGCDVHNMYFFILPILSLPTPG